MRIHRTVGVQDFDSELEQVRLNSASDLADRKTLLELLNRICCLVAGKLKLAHGIWTASAIQASSAR